MLLDHWNFFGRHFDAEIASRDHDSVSDFQDLFQMVDGLRLFEFRDDRDIALVRGDDLLDLRDIGGGAHERERHRVDTVLQSELEVLAIFFGQERESIARRREG